MSIKAAQIELDSTDLTLRRFLSKKALEAVVLVDQDYDELKRQGLRVSIPVLPIKNCIRSNDRRSIRNWLEEPQWRRLVPVCDDFGVVQ